MKFFLLIIALLISSGCVSHASSVSEVNKTAQPTPTIADSNSNSSSQYSYTDYQYDQALIDRLNEENEKFREVPDEFKSVDFENFEYDFGRLKNGKLERNQTDDRIDGAFIFNFGDVFYVNLIGDEKKEAVVFLYRVSCGASCDGGADFVYFYSSNKGKAKLIDILETGANSGGCSLKTFTIRDKKIYVEQFGRCLKNSAYEENKEFVCKFCVKDETHSVYSITGDGLKRDSADILETSTVNVMNSPAIISIND